MLLFFCRNLAIETIGKETPMTTTPSEELLMTVESCAYLRSVTDEIIIKYNHKTKEYTMKWYTKDAVGQVAERVMSDIRDVYEIIKNFRIDKYLIRSDPFTKKTLREKFGVNVRYQR